MTENEVLYMFVDGACVPNPGRGGWAYLLDWKDRRKVANGIVDEDQTTNQRAELTAAIEAFGALKANGRRLKIEVVSDSQYLIKSMSDEWNPKTNLDLFDMLENLASNHDVTWTWIKGHSGNARNETVDKLAEKMATLAYQKREK